jgi:hypothetical protein
VLRVDNLLEPSGPVQACNGMALPLPLQINLSRLLRLGHGSGYCWPFPANVLVVIGPQVFRLMTEELLLGQGVLRILRIFLGRIVPLGFHTLLHIRCCCSYEKNKHVKFVKSQEATLF